MISATKRKLERSDAFGRFALRLSANLHEKALFCVATDAMSSAYLGHFSLGGTVGPLAPVDVRRVVALLGDFGHEGMMGR